MADEPQISPETQITAETPQATATVEAAPEALETPKRKPRKPRAPRKKKAEATTPAAEATPIAVPAPTEPPIKVDAPAAPVEPSPVQVETVPLSTPVSAVEPASEFPAPETENGHVHRLRVRRDGRKPLDINLGPNEHVWERLISADDQQINFRFKAEPTPDQMELIQRQGFVFDEQRKEASRPNDPTGRLHADRLAWYLKQLQREQAVEVASR